MRGRSWRAEGSGAPSRESGVGSIYNNEVLLQGALSGSGWRYTATYRGHVHGNAMELTGAQVWNSARLRQPYQRQCRADLRLG